MVKSCEDCRFNADREFDFKRCKACSRTDRAHFEKNPNAAEIMQQLMEKGIYPSLKNVESRINSIKKTMQKQLSDSEANRHEYTRFNIVAKFVQNKISEIDYRGLNEYLHDIGLLVPVLKMDHKEIKKDELIFETLAAYRYDPTNYVKPNFNKKGKELNKPSHFDPEEWGIDHLVGTYVNLVPQLDNYQREYEMAKKLMLQCNELRQEKKIPHEYGSVSLVANEPTYDIQSIYKDFGEDMLIQYGKPDSDKLQYFIQKGVITKNEIDQFKTVVDIRLDFVMMNLDTEKQMLSMLQNRTIQTSQNRLRA